METWKTAIEMAEGLATVAALIAGGIWAYLAYIRQRLGFPRLDVTISHQDIEFSSARLLRVKVQLGNCGPVIVKSRRGELRCRQVVPLPEEVVSLVSQGYDPVPEGSAQIEWPLLVGRPWAWERGEFEIEPGETDTLQADFFLPDDVKVVELYFHLHNATKKRQNIGWTFSTVVNIGGTNEEERIHGEAATPSARTAPAATASPPDSNPTTQPAGAKATPAAATDKDQI